ncbi:SDR family oxidoreductase, partial [Tsukamurella strandjordii]|uniref:SDR family oxidoreductase n=2 Tax=Tsukamurella TaxID=2060 RepID=UPI0039F01A17
MAKFVVIGGTGLIGSQVVSVLRGDGHEVIVGAPSTGINAVTGEGLAGALDGADVVIDVANSPSFEDDAVLEFFTASTGNLLAAEKAAGVRHHVALSVVGTDRLAESGYFRGKIKQEELIRDGGVPYSIVRATQFFEFVPGIAAASTVDGVIRLPGAGIAPIASADVAAAVASAA